jgi:glycosyltransferase involved in cell wall biosynthesis
MPLVSIGVPVYNGADYLPDTLTALLGQSWRDLEVVISDNLSTDGTSEICRKFASANARVRYHRTERLLPPAENHNRTFELSTGQYFKWAAHDDLCGPEFVEQCVRVLEADPSVVLCYPHATIIDEDGRSLMPYSYSISTGDPRASRRFGSLVCADHRFHGAFEIYGVIRSDALRSIPPMGNYARGDSLILARLALLGRFHELEQVMFYSRDHASRSVRTLPARKANTRTRLSRFIGVGPLPPVEWWDPSRRDKLNFPEWRVLKEYAISVERAPIPRSEKLACCGWLARSLWSYSPKLARDVIIAAEQLIMGKPGQPARPRRTSPAGN